MVRLPLRSAIPFMRRPILSWVALFAALFTSCTGAGPNAGADQPTTSDEAMDTHTHASASNARITHLDLDIRVDMDARTISGTAGYAIDPNGSDTLYLDTDGLKVDAVRVDGRPVEFTETRYNGALYDFLTDLGT